LSSAEQARSHHTKVAIGDVLRAHDDLSRRDFELYVKGSYLNETTIPFDSDVDICAELTEFFAYTLPAGVPIASWKDLGIEPPRLSTYTSAQFKKDVETALVHAYGREAVIRGPAAIRVTASDAVLAADVVPCVEFRKYYLDPSGTLGYHQGIRITPDQGEAFENYPRQHHVHGVARDRRTGHRFKKVVRILKRMENELAADGLVKPVPSFLIECLVYNVADACFGHETHVDDVRSVLSACQEATVREEFCSGWLECNEIQPLFRPRDQAMRIRAQEFARAGLRYLEQ
jgi:hypothetical protein